MVLYLKLIVTTRLSLFSRAGLFSMIHIGIPTLIETKSIEEHIQIKEFAIKEDVADSLTVALLDKDNRLPKITGYYIKKPEESFNIIV